MIVMNTSHLGEQVRLTRKAQGLTQERLAASAGVGIRFIRELERGKPTCEIGKVLAVLEMLGLDVHITPRGNQH